jgi:hypothetical protein
LRIALSNWFGSILTRGRFGARSVSNRMRGPIVPRRNSAKEAAHAPARCGEGRRAGGDDDAQAAGLRPPPTALPGQHRRERADRLLRRVPARHDRPAHRIAQARAQGARLGQAALDPVEVEQHHVEQVVEVVGHAANEALQARIAERDAALAALEAANAERARAEEALRQSQKSRLSSTTLSRLLKSWATPPVSCPIASIFWLWRRLWVLIPKALTLPSPTQLRQANEALQARIAERDAALAALEAANAEPCR